MATGNGPLTPVALSAAIVRTRSELGSTLEELHGRLNPGVFKDEVLRQFHAAKESLKDELRADMIEVRETFKADFEETKESLKAGIQEATHDFATEVKSELSEAKDALREATIGKVETMIHNTQDTLKATGRTLVGTIRENPIPTAMVGVGLVWLIARARSRPSHAELSSDLSRGKSEPRSTFAADVQSSARGAMHAASEKISSLAHGAQSSISDAAHATSDKLGTLAHSAAEQGRHLGARAEETYAEHPLVVGAALVAAGAALGFSVPMSKREGQWMGAASAQVIHKAESLANDAMTKVEGAAMDLADNTNPSAPASRRGQATDGEMHGNDHGGRSSL